MQERRRLHRKPPEKRASSRKKNSDKREKSLKSFKQKPVKDITIKIEYKKLDG